jgi:hypothetical protein
MRTGVPILLEMAAHLVYIPIVRLSLCRHPRFCIVGGAECVGRRRVSLSVPDIQPDGGENAFE